jgi:hypothetical protein
LQWMPPWFGGGILTLLGSTVPSSAHASIIQTDEQADAFIL